MRFSSSVLVILCIFALVAGFGIYTLFQNPQESNTKNLINKTFPSIEDDKALPKTQGTLTNPKIEQTSILPQIDKLLQSGAYTQLEDLVLTNYSELNSNELEELRRAMHLKASSLRRSEKSRESIELLQTIAAIFDDKESWKLIGLEAALQKDWSTSYSALLKASQLENDSLKLTELLNSLAHASNLYTSSLLEQKDLESALNVAESLYFSHPSFPQFQYNYAQALVALGRLDEAKNILISLKNEPNFTVQSDELLSNIQAIEEASRQDYRPDQTDLTPTDELAQRSIDIPLKRYGTSFIAQTKINGRSISLLLDTGASITALNNQSVQRLGLTATGQTITLDTANGRTQSNLYQANSIELNGVTIKNAVIASIDMPDNPNFVGLLGTDILNSKNGSHSFVLDTSKPALIFEPSR